MNLVDLRSGTSLPGDNQSDPRDPPPWLNREKFDRGRHFFQQHFVSLLLCMYTSLVAGLAVRNLLDPLVYTGRSDTPSKAFKRYLSTFKHVVLWHIGDVWDSDDDAFKSISAVRQMHSDVARDMNQDFHKNDVTSANSNDVTVNNVKNSENVHTNGNVEGNCIRSKRGKERDLHVSQYDMSLVQSGFMGMVVLYPREFGVQCSESDLEDYIHFWRGIGYLLGMDDQYNICSGNYLQTYQICKEIQGIVLESLIDPPVRFIPMAEAFIAGSNTPFPIPFFSYNSISSWLKDIGSDIFNSDGIRQKGALCIKMTLGDHIRLIVFKSLCWLLRSCPKFERSISSWFIRNWCRYLHYTPRDHTT